MVKSKVAIFVVYQKLLKPPSKKKAGAAAGGNIKEEVKKVTPSSIPSSTSQTSRGKRCIDLTLPDKIKGSSSHNIMHSSAPNTTHRVIVDMDFDPEIGEVPLADVLLHCCDIVINAQKLEDSKLKLAVRLGQGVNVWKGTDEDTLHTATEGRKTQNYEVLYANDAFMKKGEEVIKLHKRYNNK